MSAKCKYYRATDREELQALLRDHGFYSTEGRLQLLSFLKMTARPVSVPELTERMGKNLVEVNIYRALESLSRKGVLVRSDIRRGGAHYEYPHTHHHHVVCSDCGVTEEIDVCAGSSIERRALRGSSVFGAIRTHALEFFGTCKACAAA